MRSIKMCGSAVLVVLALAALVGVSGASAANWDPANVTVPVTGTPTITTNLGTSVMCSLSSTFIRSPGGDHSVTTDSAGTQRGPQWTGCTNSVLTTGTSMTSTGGIGGAWTLTATSATSVDLAGVDLTIAIGSFCTISVMNAAIANNTWSNVAHLLTFNSSTTLPTAQTGLCPAGGTTLSIAGSVTLPSTVGIT
jgi:hypothetical protein